MTPPIVVGIPAVAWIYTRAAISLFRLLRDELPPESVTIFESGFASWISKRNQIVRHFLARPPAFSHLLLLDSDMIFPVGMVPRLLAADKDVIGAPYTLRVPPFGVVGGSAVSPDGRGRREGACCWPAEIGQGLQRVNKIGGGVMLIKRRVLQTMAGTGPVWFYAPEEYGDADDYWFCEKAEAAGFEIWMDTDLDLGHMTIAPVTPRSAPYWLAGWPEV